MAGDPNNTNVWSEADVLIGPLTAVVPADGAPFATTPGNWDAVGILDGSAGFGEDQSFDSTDFFGWGYGKVASTKKNFALTRTFTALEKNLITLGLVYDASGVATADGITSGKLKVRDLNLKFLIAFELRNGDEIERYISENYAVINAVGTSTASEDALASVALTVDIFPSADKELWDYFKGVPE